MKRLLAVLMVCLVVVGCSSVPIAPKKDYTTTAIKADPKVVYTTSFKEDIYDDDLMEIWEKAILNKDNFRFLDFISWEHYPEMERVDGHDKDLYTINSKYLYDKKVYGNRMLIRFTGPGRYEIVRYTNYWTGN